MPPADQREHAGADADEKAEWLLTRGRTGRSGTAGAAGAACRASFFPAAFTTLGFTVARPA